MKLPQFLRRKKPSPPAPDAPEPLREEAARPLPRPRGRRKRSSTRR